MTGYEYPEWMRAARAQGWGGLLGTALDALEPLGPIGAQLVWVTQPVVGLFVRRDALAALARSLEEPGGVQALRRWLDDEDAPDEDTL